MMHIKVLATDISAFYETGFGGIESCHNFYMSIKPFYDNVSFHVIRDLDNLRTILKEKSDLIVCGFKYLKVNDNIVWMSQLLDDLGINYLGNPKNVLDYDSDKEKAKIRVSAIGLPTAKFKILTPDIDIRNTISDLKYPLFAKPLATACSFGVDDNSFITSYNQLKNKVNEIDELYKDKALVEEYLPGREFTVGIIGNNNDLLVAPIELGEFSLDGYQFLTRNVKMDNLENARYIRENKLRNMLSEYSKKIYTELGICDFARIDFKLDLNGIPNFLEVNLLPGFNKGRSYFPLAFEKNFGFSYEDTVNKVVQAGIKRNKLL